MAETLAQITRRTRDVISSLKTPLEIQVEFEARAKGIAELGFSQMPVKNMVELFTGYFPNKEMIAGSTGNTVRTPSPHKYEWVYDQKTGTVQEGANCTWTSSPMNYWRKDHTLSVEIIFITYDQYRVHSDVTLGCLDYLKTAIPTDVESTLKKLKESRVFNSFQVLAGSNSWVNAQANNAGIVIGNLWDIIDIGKKEIGNRQTFFVDRW